MESQEDSKKQHKRNTSGLMVGKDKPEVVQKPVDKPASGPIIDPNEDSFKPHFHRGVWAATEADVKRIDYEMQFEDDQAPF